MCFFLKKPSKIVQFFVVPSFIFPKSSMVIQILDALLAVMAGIGVCVLYYAGTNVILDRIFSEKNGLLSGKYRLQNTIQPWIFLAPALFFLGFYLVYPVYETLRLSFFNFGGFEFC